jgi:hypothetical protein
MGSRLVAAALAVALLGCGGGERKPDGGGDMEVERVQTDKLDAYDSKTAAQEFARKVSAQRAAGSLKVQVVQVSRARNEAQSSFDMAGFQRAVEEELTKAGLEVLADPRSEAAEQAAQDRGYEDATGGESEAEALQKEKRADGLITLYVTSEKRVGGIYYTLSSKLMDRAGTLLVSSVTNISKMKE